MEYCPKCGKPTSTCLQVGEERNFHIESCKERKKFFVVFRRVGLAPTFNLGKEFVDKHGGINKFADKDHSQRMVNKFGYGRYFECEPA